MKKIFSGFSDNIGDVAYVLRQFRHAKYGGRYIILRIFAAVFESLFPIIFMIMPGLIINELSGERRVSVLTVYVSILCFSPLLNHLKDMTIGSYTDRISGRLKRLFEIRLHEYVSDMEYSSYESPEIAVQLSRILNYAPNAPIDMVNYLLGMLRAVIGVVSVISVIAILSPFVVILLVLIVIINAVANKKIGVIVHDRNRAHDDKNRFLWSEFDNLSNPQNSKELRLFGLKDYFIGRYSAIVTELDDCLHENNVYIKRLRSITVITGVLQQLFLYAFSVVRVIGGALTIGSMTIFMSAGNQLAGSLNAITSSYLAIADYCLNIKEIKAFMKMPNMKDNSGAQKPELRPDSAIEFAGVSFRYPGSDVYAIRDLNLKIPLGQKLCIVGKNGSGKSTFIKLLTMLYFPTEGEILLDGVNIRNFDRFDYMKLFAPVFQDYSKYRMSLIDNIALENEPDVDRVMSAVEKSELASLIPKLKNGPDTYVGKQVYEDGFEPSGGEGQKIAIARALYHDRPIYLLDEPTAALDPAAEYEIYNSFTHIITDRTAVLITHRMSAVQLADKVAVFDDGHVAEYGTHAELYAKGGIYTEMFDRQAKFYRDLPSEPAAESDGEAGK